jgi:hypothetical protein
MLFLAGDHHACLMQANGHLQKGLAAGPQN